MLRHVGTLLIVLPAFACAQGTVEYAAGTAAAAAGTSAAAKSAGKSIANTMNKLKGMMEPEGPAKPNDPAAPAARAKVPARKIAPVAKTQQAPAIAPGPAAPAPPPSYEDPAGIQEGMLYADVVRRFGPPALELTTGPGEQTLSYAKNGASFDIRVSSGKVVAVQKAGGA